MGDTIGGDKIEGDKIAGDKIAGDKVEGNKVETGPITGSGNVVAGGDITFETETVEVKKYFFIFHSWKEVLVFFAITIVVSLVVGYGIWRTKQPNPMTGEFNIAVAEFMEVPQTPQPVIAPIVSQMLFNFLHNEYQVESHGSETQILHEKIGIISGPVEAEKLAQRLKAQVVLYGDVVVLGNKATISPKFFVSESYKSDVGELIGQHQLALPMEFSTEEIINFNSEINKDIRQRTGIMVELTKALSYLSSNDLPGAYAAIKASIDLANLYGNFEGKEVLYLLASTITREMKDFALSESYANQAIANNSSYARAYIALANIYYDRNEFEQAIQYYQDALLIPNQPFGAHIVEKANLNLGHLYTYLYQTADPTEKPEYKSKALEHYQAVIDLFEDKHDPRMKEFAAWAYYGGGIIYQLEGDTKDAENAYQQALSLTEDADLISRAKTRLEDAQ
jgi:tetratricopeptide (TPR) repeat protein